MNILSIDVGMRHLAYCVLSKECNCHKILDWDIIDLCSEQTNTCCGKKKNGDICAKPAKYYKNNKFFCKLHAKKEPLGIPPSNMNLSKIKKMKIKELKDLVKNKNYKLPKKRKKVVYIDAIIHDLSNNYLNPIIKTNSRNINFVTYGRRIKKSFDALLLKTHIDCMIIENQIGPLALRMKMIQGMIMQHFIEIECKTIKEISPANKLKDFTDKKKTSYAERKKMGIQITRNLINENNNISEWKGHFEKHKKKDDLADSYLQGLWYIKQ